MRSFDFSPLYRATVGFDRVADLMDRVLAADVAQPTYPPYNIEKTDENAYRISIAVAGFAPEELNVELREGALIVAGRKTDEAEAKTYLHRGIAARGFTRTFVLADGMKVDGAVLAHGLLHIDLVRPEPERLVQRIPIKTAG